MATNKVEKDEKENGLRKSRRLKWAIQVVGIIVCLLMIVITLVYIEPMVAKVITVVFFLGLMIVILDWPRDREPGKTPKKGDGLRRLRLAIRVVGTIALLMLGTIAYINIESVVLKMITVVGSLILLIANLVLFHDPKPGKTP